MGKIKNVYNQEWADSIVLKKYPFLKSKRFYKTPKYKKIFEYYDPNISDGIGSYNEPYSWWDTSLQKRSFSIWRDKKTSFENINKIVLEKYPHLTFLKKYMKGSACNVLYYDKNIENGYGSIHDPYDWRCSRITQGSFVIFNKWTKERADALVHKKYPNLLFLEQFKKHRGTAYFKYYNPEKEYGYGSKSEPYIWRSCHLEEYFSIDEGWTKERADEIVYRIYPNLVYKNKWLDSHGTAQFEYYDPKIENGKGSKIDPYIWSSSALAKQSISIEQRKGGEMLCLNAIKIISKNFKHDKATMQPLKLRPDFTLYDFETYIEVNGSFHYIPHHGAKKFKQQNIRDNIKKQYAEEHMWNLLILPNPLDNKVPKKTKITLYLANKYGLKILELLKNSSIFWWFNKFEIEIIE